MLYEESAYDSSITPAPRNGTLSSTVATTLAALTSTANATLSNNTIV